MLMLLSTRRRVALASCAAAMLAGAVLAGCAGRLGAPGLTSLPAASQPVDAAKASGSPSAANAFARPNRSLNLNLPIALVEDKNDNLYVGNTDSNEILVYNSKNQLQASKTITDGIVKPAGLALDASGNLWVVDATLHEVVAYAPSGQRIMSKTIVLGGRGENALFPSGIAIDPSGNVWVAFRDSHNYGIGEIKVFNSSGMLISSTMQHLEYPVGITIFNGEVWVCDSTTPSGNALTVFSLSGSYLRTVSTPNFQPTYAAVHNGNLYTTDGTTAATKFLAVIDAAGNVLRMTSPKNVSLPYGIAFNKAGDYFIANVGNNTITEYSSHGLLIHTIANPP
jgi:sugar lactone lactonase YvrE